MVPSARGRAVTRINRTNGRTQEWRLFANMRPETRMVAQIPQVRFPPPPPVHCFKSSTYTLEAVNVLVDYL
jgi:hypothetical protein